MCSDCRGGWDGFLGNDDETEAVQLCECGHEVELHDSLGCQVQSLTFRCKCKRTIEELLFGRGIGAMAILTQQQINFITEVQREAAWITGGGRHAVDTETFRCSCGAGMCRECGGCEKQCGGRHDGR